MSDQIICNSKFSIINQSDFACPMPLISFYSLLDLLSHLPLHVVAKKRCPPCPLHSCQLRMDKNVSVILNSLQPLPVIISEPTVNAPHHSCIKIKVSPESFQTCG